MCGIAGWFGFRGSARPGSGLVAELSSALRHRGPDAGGTRVFETSGLVHTRLRILDLSPFGDQPLSNETGDIWTIFNGEIYNHEEIRIKLEMKGHVFRGRSDTEVIPHLYEERGEAFLEDLRGMFAIAVIDLRRKRLVLARDRFGIKPLYFGRTGGGVCFASELNALLLFPGLDRTPDLQALSDFIALLFIPAPATFYRGARSVEPGEVVVVEERDEDVRIAQRKYHRWRVIPRRDLSAAEALQTTGELLDLAVGSQLESDAPLGALLSGGIDSSLVSEAAARARGGSLRTFNVRFPDRSYDETWAALSVAERIGSQHQTVDLGSGLADWDDVCKLLRQIGQPFADTSLFGVNLVCREMRKHVTVALSGDGGDETFGGYASFWRIGPFASWQRLPSAIQALAASFLEQVTRPWHGPSTIPARLREIGATDDVGLLATLHCWIRDQEQRNLLGGRVIEPARRLFEPSWEIDLPKNSSRIERLSAANTEVAARLILPNDYLVKVDIASMSHGLEVRVPMLDEELFGFGLSLPHRLKVRGRTGKRLLRALARKRLPREVARKPKAGFGVPVDTWVGAEFFTALRDTLSGTSSPLRNLLNEKQYLGWVDAFAEKRPLRHVSREGLYQRVIALLSLHLALGGTK